MFRGIKLILRLIAESLAVSYLGLLLSFIAEFAVMLFVGRGRWLDALFIAPTFLLPMAAGIFLTYLFRKHLAKTSYFAWIVPAVALIAAVSELNRGRQSGTVEIWNHLFSAQCESSECLYEVFVSVPLVCGISYSVSSFFVRTGNARRLTNTGNGS